MQQYPEKPVKATTRPSATLPPAHTTKLQNHSYIQNFINDIRLIDKSITFPSSKLDGTLNAEDYTNFFMMLSQKYQEASLTLANLNLKISCSTDLASIFKGLGECREILPCSTITLKIGRFGKELPEAIINFRNEKIAFIISGSLKNETITNLCNSIRTNICVINITLPKPDSPSQRFLDQTFSMRSREKRLLDRTKTVSQSIQNAENKPLRTRLKNGKLKADVSVEMQQESQQQNQQEQQAETTFESKDEIRVLGENTYDRNAFTAIPTTGPKLMRECYLDHEIQLDHHDFNSVYDNQNLGSQTVFLAMWNNWFGLLNFDNSQMEITESALIELLKHHIRFTSGIDLERLPAGFSIVENKREKVSILCFSEKLKALASYDPLRVQCKRAEHIVPLSFDLIQSWLNAPIKTDQDTRLRELWSTFNDDPNSYHKIPHNILEKYLPELRNLDMDSLKEVLASVMNEHAFLEKLHEFEPSNQPITPLLDILLAKDQITLDLANSLKENHKFSDAQLVRVFDYAGYHGIIELDSKIKGLNPKIFEHLNEHLFSKMQTLVPLFSEEYASAIDAISSFSSRERTFWNHLFEGHCEIQGVDHLPDLVNAFKAFCKQLNEYNQIYNIQIQLNDILPKSGKIHSLPVAISRMLTILKECRPQDLKAQVLCFPGVDLSSTGCIKALRSNNSWQFYTPEMELNYDYFSGRQKLIDWNKLHKKSSTLLKNYYRYVSNVNDNQNYSLEFYQTTLKKMRASQVLDIQIQNKALGLVAGGTTHSACTYFSITEDKALTIVDNLIKLLENPPSPIPLPEDIKQRTRLHVLGIFLGLLQPVPLPVLFSFLQMINNMVASPITFLTRRDDINIALDRLNKSVETYGSCIYQGLKNHSDEFYDNNPNYFIEYFELIQHIIDKKLHNNYVRPIIGIISTFKLTIKDIDLFINKYPNPDSDLIFILNQAETLNHPKISMSINELLAYFEAVAMGKTALEVVKADPMLSTCISKEFLDNYGKPAIPGNIEALIKKSSLPEKELLKKILMRFTSNAKPFEALVNKLILLQKYIGAEKISFLFKLLNSEFLYGDKVASLGGDDDFFMKLIDSMLKERSIDNVIFIVSNIEQYLHRKGIKHQENAFYVIWQYQQNLFPEMEKIPNKHISQIALLPLASHTLLATPPLQLSMAYQNKVLFEFLSTREQCLPGLATIISRHENFLQCMEKTQPLTMIDLMGNYIDFKTLWMNCSALIDDMALLSLIPDIKLNETKKLQEMKFQNQTMDHDLFLQIAVDPNSHLHAILSLCLNPDAHSLFNQLDEENKTLIQNISEYKNILGTLIATPWCMQKLLHVQNLWKSSLLNSPHDLQAFLKALEADVERLDEFHTSLNNAHKEMLTIQTAVFNLQYYPAIFKKFIEKIHVLAEKNPIAKMEIIEVFRALIEQHAGGNVLLEEMHKLINIMDKLFTHVEDKNIVLTLCYGFKNTDPKKFQPQHLYKLLSFIDRSCIDTTEKNLFLKIATISMDGDSASKLLKDLETLYMTYDFFRNKGISQVFHKFYQSAPYFNASTAIKWILDAQSQGMESAGKRLSNTDIETVKRQSEEIIQAEYGEAFPAALFLSAQKFEINPFNRKEENNENGFHLNEAIDITQKNPSFDHGLTQDNLRLIAHEYDLATTFSIEALQFKYQNYAKNQNMIGLVVIAAELLCRSKGWELRTMQYLAIFAMVLKGKRVSAGIGTGEGKSRISLVLIACQHASGMTVDFVTADISLATRDYLNAQPFFDIIGAKSSLIYANSDPKSYVKQGINYSDPANINLFRNKAYTLGLASLVIDDDLKKRALVLDESDKLFFDFANTRFNYSVNADKCLQDIAWIYDLLHLFFAKDSDRSRINNYYDNIDNCNQLFFGYASKTCDSEQLSRLKLIPLSQIEQWHTATLTAKQLQYQRDYVIETALIQTPKGPMYSSVAKLLDDNNRVSTHSQFSFGVQQCLHARLNGIQKLSHLLEPEDPLKVALEKHCHPFYIQDEKQIVFSTTSKNSLDCYNQGMIYAISGTPGDLIEKREANYFHSMEFVTVPRAKGMKRKQTIYFGSKNSQGHKQSILDQIHIALNKNQPILIVCENDRESAALYKYFNLDKSINKSINTQLIHSALTYEKEAAMIAKAGEPKFITVGTPMVGRGTDIPIDEKKAPNGLCVIITYLPETREEEQIVGRAGRNGQNGDAIVTVNTENYEDLRKLENIFTGNIKFIQSKKDIFKQRERLIKFMVADLRSYLQNAFFKKMHTILAPDMKETMLQIWSDFANKADKEWNIIWPAIQDLIPTGDEPRNINKILGDYAIILSKLWDTLCENLINHKISADGLQNPEIELRLKPEHKMHSNTSLFLFLQNCTKGNINTMFAPKYSIDLSMMLQTLTIMVKNASMRNNTDYSNMDEQAVKIILPYLDLVLPKNKDTFQKSELVNANETFTVLQNLKQAFQWFSFNKDTVYILNGLISDSLKLQLDDFIIMDTN